MPPQLRVITSGTPPPIATTTPFRRRRGPGEQSSFESRVELALRVMTARAPRAADDLFDLVSRPVYTLALAITGDSAVAQDVAVDAFTEIWLSCADRPEGAGTPWVMDIVCRCARSRLDATTPVQDKSRLRLVPTA